MEKRAGNRALSRKKKRLEREKKRRIEQANRMLIPANKKTKQSLGILSFDPKGVFRFKENRWMKVFELNENALREIVIGIAKIMVFLETNHREREVLLTMFYLKKDMKCG